MNDIHSQRILILDFGSQYTQLIARRVREANVYSEIFAYDMAEADIKAFKPTAIILSGGPESVTEDNRVRAPEYVFEAGVPVLGICYGMQTMAAQLGGQVESSELREFGYARVRARGHSELLKDIQDASNDEGHGLLDVWMSHGDHVTEPRRVLKSLHQLIMHRSPVLPMKNEIFMVYSFIRKSRTPGRASPFSSGSCTT